MYQICSIIVKHGLRQMFEKKKKYFSNHIFSLKWIQFQRNVQFALLIYFFDFYNRFFLQNIKIRGLFVIILMLKRKTNQSQLQYCLFRRHRDWNRMIWMLLYLGHFYTEFRIIDKTACPLTWRLPQLLQYITIFTKSLVKNSPVDVKWHLCAN